MTSYKSWNVELDAGITQLSVGLPGRSFVTPSSDGLFTVTVTSDSTTVLENVILNTQLGSGRLEIHLDDTLDVNLISQNSFLAEIAVPPHLLKEVECVGTGPCVIEEGCVQTDLDLRFANKGTGNMIIELEDTTLRYFTMVNSGTGDMELKSKRFVAQRTQVFNNGNGAVYFHAKNDELLPMVMEVQVDGSGSIYIQGSPLNATNINSFVNGAGNINYLPKGTCPNHEIMIKGSGNVYAGSIACQATMALIEGSGSAIVHTLRNLITDVVGPGSVSYVADVPIKIRTDNGTAAPVMTDDNRYETIKEQSIPDRVAGVIVSPLPTTLPVPTEDGAETTMPVPVESTAVVSLAPNATTDETIQPDLITPVTFAPLVPEGSFESKTPLTWSPVVTVPSTVVKQGQPPSHTSHNEFQTVMWFLAALVIAIVLVVCFIARSVRAKRQQYTMVK